MYLASHSLVYMYSVYLDYNSVGVHMHTWARVQVEGIETEGIDPDKDDVEEITYVYPAFFSPGTPGLLTFR